MKSLYRQLSLLIGAVAISLSITLPASAGVPEDTDPTVTTAPMTSAVSRGWAAQSAIGVNASISQKRTALRNRALTEGTIPVIVRFKTPSATTSGTGGASAQPAAALVASSKQEALRSLGLSKGIDRVGNRIKHFAQFPALAMQVDALDLDDLMANPNVEEVVEDIPHPPALVESVPLLGASADRSYSGYSGKGQVIAILDTGVDKSHPFLAGKVVSEACYSSTYSTQGATSLCPGGVTETIAVGSGVNCSGADGCDHGTHVAGIAAGNGGSFSGVAKDATIIAIQVYSKFPAAQCGSASPCVMAYTSDIIKGLERVYTLSTSYQIASANLSLGGAFFTAPCDSDPTKPLIDKLLATGIATVIASGNDGYTKAVAAPGCVSSAVTVGSSTKTDTVSSFSNSAYFVDLLAPGESIQSSVSGGGYQYWNGTSMATPHVAGIWAVMKSAKPTASVNEILTALRSTGRALTDPDNGLVIPRPKVDAALAALSTNPSLSPPVASAASAISTAGFTANWGSVTGATGYVLDVSTSSSFASFVTGYKNLSVGTATSSTVKGLAAGTTYYYRVRAVNAAGTSPNSATVSVKTATATATLSKPMAKPATKITATSFTANWASVANAAAYTLQISTSSTFATGVEATFSVYQTLPAGTTMSASISGLARGTTYYYRVKAANSTGASDFSNVVSVKTSR